MRIIQGVLIGCAVGVLLGVLFAPKRGEETRADVHRWVQERQEQAQQQVAQVQEQATKVLAQGRQRANIALDVVQRATGQVAETARAPFTRSN